MLQAATATVNSRTSGGKGPRVKGGVDIVPPQTEKGMGGLSGRQLKDGITNFQYLENVAKDLCNR